MSTNTLQALTVDAREPSWIQELHFGGVPKNISLLDTGDVWALCSDGQIVVIERKTADDLLNTLRAGRLLPECARMLDVSRYAYLVITGSMAPDLNGMAVTARTVTGWQWAAVQGALLSIQELGIGVIHFGQDTDFEQAVKWLAGRRRDPVMLIPPVKTPQVLSVGESILASLPGIGLERAQAIMTHCGTSAQALVFLTDMSDAGKLDGIGPGIKAKIRAALGVPEWGELVLVDSKFISQGA
jgi:ERCC4-type nuclease